MYLMDASLSFYVNNDYGLTQYMYMRDVLEKDCSSEKKENHEICSRTRFLAKEYIMRKKRQTYFLLDSNDLILI